MVDSVRCASFFCKVNLKQLSIGSVRHQITTYGLLSDFPLLTTFVSFALSCVTGKLHFGIRIYLLFCFWRYLFLTNIFFSRNWGKFVNVIFQRMSLDGHDALFCVFLTTLPKKWGETKLGQNDHHKKISFAEVLRVTQRPRFVSAKSFHMSLVDGHGSLFYMFLTMISFSFQKWGAKNLGHNDHNKKCEGHSTAKVCFRQEFPLVNSYETPEGCSLLQPCINCTSICNRNCKYNF